MYFDYQKYIKDFLGFSGNGLFIDEIESIFDIDTLFKMINGKTICSYSGEIKKALYGYIDIKNINETLKRICDLDIFGNRFSSDISLGFLSGDLLYIKNGMEIRMDMDMKIDNGVQVLLEKKLNCNSGISSIELKKIYSAPLLIRVI